MHHALTISLVVFLVGCGGRPLPGEPPVDPGSPDDGEGPPVNHPPGMLACDAPAQLLAAAVSLDGALSTVLAVEGSVYQASSGAPPGGASGFANHGVTVRYLLEGDPEVRVHLALDRLLAIGESVALDPAAPAPGSVSIARGGATANDELWSGEGDLFAGWTRVTRISQLAFTATFCLLGWRDGATTASFTWARVTLPELTFTIPSY
jgi:hypothetical protein